MVLTPGPEKCPVWTRLSNEELCAFPSCGFSERARRTVTAPSHSRHSVKTGKGRQQHEARQSLYLSEWLPGIATRRLGIEHFERATKPESSSEPPCRSRPRASSRSKGDLSRRCVSRRRRIAWASRRGAESCSQMAGIYFSVFLSSLQRYSPHACTNWRMRMA
jgi:hypothetical protein